MNEVVVSGLAMGSSYSLLALALVLILKATDVPNFAMAATGLLATYVAWTLLTRGVPYPAAIVLLLSTGGALGWLADRAVGRRLLGRPHYVTVVVTIALWSVLSSAIALIWGSDTRIIPVPYPGSLRIGRLVVTDSQLVVLGAVIVVTAGLTVLFRTETGLQLRALSMDARMARVLGVSVSRLSSLAWALASAIAALAVMLYAQTSALSTSSGDDLLIGAFVAATLGGFTSVVGAAVGGLALGVVEAEAGSAVAPSAEYAVALIVVLVVLLVRPAGLLGETAGRQV